MSTTAGKGGALRAKGRGPQRTRGMGSLSHQRPRAGPLKYRLYIDGNSEFPTANEEKYQMYNHQQSEAST